jgi:propionyl-CoA synthetase
MTGAKARFSYDETLDQVARLAASLQDLGVRKGDRVILYMPMIPQALFGMLACARIGAIHSVVFGGFAPTNWPPASAMPSPR